MRWLPLLLLLIACGQRSRIPTPQPGRDGGAMDSGPAVDGGFAPQLVKTAVVIDGDTIIIDAAADLRTPEVPSKPLDGETIRLIGVSAPEIAHDEMPAECYGDEAKAYLDDQIGGRIIELSYDVGNGVRGNFGRLLAYVSRGGAVVNEQLIATGHAEALRGFRHREQTRYFALERDAQDQNLGLWQTCQ